jgi:hypothetical protein
MINKSSIFFREDFALDAIQLKTLKELSNLFFIHKSLKHFIELKVTAFLSI